MKYSKFILLTIGIVVMGILAAMRVSPYITKAAFGTSPPWVRNDHLLPGSTYEQIINLSRNETDQDMKVETRIEGDKEILKWLKIENEGSLIMRKGVMILPMKVVVKVPRQAALKDYKGGIFVTLESMQEPTDLQGGNVAIKLGAHILVELAVTGEKVTNYRIRSVTLDELQKGQNFNMNVEVENLGNTEITDLTGQVEIYNKNETEILKTLTFGKLDTAVSPDEVVKTKINFTDLILDPGEYWVVIKVFKDNETIYENRLYQKVNEETAITENFTVKKPGIPKLPQETEVQPGTETGKGIESAEQPIMHEAAKKSAQSNNFLVIFGIIGISFGLLSMIAIIVLLIILIRNQRQTAIQRYLTEHKLHNE